MMKYIKIVFLSVLGLFMASQVHAVTPTNSSNWADFRGTITSNITSQYASIIFDTDDNGTCETSDLTGAVQVSVSPKDSWLVGNYSISNASISLGFSMPTPSYQTRGLCLRYNSAGYLIEPAPAFFYLVPATPTPTGTPLFPMYLSDISSSSIDILPVYSYMTAGDIAIVLCLFVLIMLQFLMFFFRKNKIL